MYKFFETTRSSTVKKLFMSGQMMVHTMEVEIAGRRQVPFERKNHFVGVVDFVAGRLTADIP